MSIAANLHIVDWMRFESHFETSSISSILDADWEKLTHHERAQKASDFLKCLYESEFAVELSDITRFHYDAGGYGFWCAFCETYSEIRSHLVEEDREIYDELYLPFIGSITEKFGHFEGVFELTDRLRQRLNAGGLSLAFSPERCKKMGELFYHYSFSRLVHEALALRSLPPPLPGRASYFHDMIDGVRTEFGCLHPRYTEMTEGWRILTQQASHRKWGLVAIFPP